ncbi:hypothetical protein GTQ34_03590 [Muricauda sp. JGD-17]|uniref:Uncharacterized protein n=1 Tax=Flagellimonas ochracea TaxID=2696472 RepID=A0A964TBI9_9FLAO|nr:hypothetical protein [Allomuricauda ochracea]NAY90993.1 hypothetical protein [Allomuricauda ochracea]
MNLLNGIFTWKINVFLTATILIALVILDFYGVYTDRFYFLKLDNYIFPLLSLIHFLYLYVIWFKITEIELPDPKMRNLEYVLYVVMIIYLFKVYDSVLVLDSYNNFSEHMVPSMFKPMAILTLVLHSILPLLTMLSFWQRKKYIGPYNFENYNDNLNIWQ